MAIVTIKLKRGTAADFATENPVLAEGEPAWTTDTGVLKIGDGTTAYNSLAAFTPPNVVKSTNVGNILKLNQTEYDEIGTYYAYVYDTTTVYVRTANPSTTTTVYSGIGTESALTVSSVTAGEIVLSDGNTYVYTASSNTVDQSQYDSNTLYAITSTGAVS